MVDLLDDRARGRPGARPRAEQSQDRTVQTPLPPPKGTLHDRRLPGHQARRADRAGRPDRYQDAGGCRPACKGPPGVVSAGCGSRRTRGSRPSSRRDRHLDLHLAVGGAQHRGDVVAQLESLGGLVEPVADDLVVGELRPGAGSIAPRSSEATCRDDRGRRPRRVRLAARPSRPASPERCRLTPTARRA